MRPSILLEMRKELLNAIQKLSGPNKKILEDIYDIEFDEVKLKIPKEMKPWATKTFGNVKNVEHQNLIKIYNKYLFEGSSFNSLRSSRPTTNQEETKIKSFKPFENTDSLTSKQEFKAITGKHSKTVANVAAYEKHHSLVVFNKRNPLNQSLNEIKSHLKTSQKWFEKVEEINETHENKLLIWNCLWRAGSSVPHGHFQLLATKKPMPYVRKLKKATKNYQEKGSNYFKDQISLYKELGLYQKNQKAHILFTLTPTKEKEIIIYTNEKNVSKMYKEFNQAYQFFKKQNIESFNASIFISNTKNTPSIIKFVDRGSLNNKSSDIGSMEIHAKLYVISSNPFKQKKLFTKFNQ